MKKGKKEIGKPLPRPGRIRLGDILAIPLGENLWGYIRDIKDASCAILSPISEDILPLESIIGTETIGYEGYCEPWDHPTWVYLGKWKFEDSEEAWPPPKYSFDILNPEIIKIYHKGEFQRTKDNELIKGMRQDEGLCFPGHLVIKIRSLHGLKSDRKQIEKFAPLTSNWRPGTD